MGIATSGRVPIMGLVKLIRESWEIVPILSLLLVGGLIALPSGVRRLTSRRDIRQFAGNFSELLLRVLGYMAVLLVVHHWIGMRPALGW
jgi:hypothetical protein